MRLLAERFAGLDASFRRLLACDALMLVSLMVGQVAVPWWIAQQGGARHLALQATVVAAASMIGMPLLAPLGDRHSKRRLIGLALAVYACSVCAMALLATLGIYRIEAIVLMVSVNVLAMAAVWPASASLVSELVPPLALPRALSLQQSAQSSGRLVGPALGGALLAAAGTAFTLWANCLMLLAAAVFALRLPSQPVHAPAVRRDWWRDLRAGLRANWAVPLERRWLLVNAFSWMFLFPALTMLAGSLGLSEALVRWCGRYATRVGGAVIQGLSLALVGFTRWPLVLVAGFLLVGLTNSAMALVGLTHRMLARPPAFRARMYAGSAMTSHVAGTLGPAIAGAALAHGASVQQVYTAFGVLAGGIALALAFVPGFRAFMALEPDAVEGWYQRMHPEAFASD